MRLSELAPADRPRERILREGAGAVRPDELLAVVLGTGRGSGEDALELAGRVLLEGDGLDHLSSWSVDALTGIRGLGPVKATRVAAAFELGRRASVAGPAPGSGDANKAEQGAQQAPPPWLQVATLLRGQVAMGEKALLGFQLERPEAPVTLALGEALGATTRAGSVMARLLTAGHRGAWFVVGVRSGGPPQRREREAAARIAAAAALVDVPMGGIVLMVGTQSFRLDDAAEVEQ